MAEGATDLFTSPAPAGEPATAVAVREDTPAPATLLSVIAMAATDPRVDVAKMQALLEMQRQIRADEARAEFNAAFARLQAKLPRIRKNKPVRFDGDKKAYDYAPWEEIDRLIRPLYIAEGFSLSFDTQTTGSAVVTTAILLHEGGHERRTQGPPLPIEKVSRGMNSLQAGGSATSYGMRYAGKLAFNLIFEGEDDDGAKGGAQPISAEQCADLQRLIRETSTNLDRFLNTFGISALPDLPAAAYPAAHNMLSTKSRRAEG